VLVRVLFLLLSNFGVGKGAEADNDGRQRGKKSKREESQQYKKQQQGDFEAVSVMRMGNGPRGGNGDRGGYGDGADSISPPRRRKLETIKSWTHTDRGGAASSAKAEGLADIIWSMRTRLDPMSYDVVPIPGYPLDDRFADNPNSLLSIDATTTIDVSADESSSTTAPTSRNDACKYAREIEVTASGMGDDYAFVIDDTSVGAAIPSAKPNRCGRITNSSPGVWFKVRGTGDMMTASLCWPTTQFDTKITVYSPGDDGDCNGIMDCVTANDDARGGLTGICRSNRQASAASWLSEPGTIYYILAHGFGNREGPFSINVVSQKPLNDHCENAELIGVDVGTAIGTTKESTVDFNGEVQNCADFYGTVGNSGGVWYHVRGTGAIYEASTCSDVTNFDTKVHVFGYGCSDIDMCLHGNDDANPGDPAFLCSSVKWVAVTGVDYYILVHGDAGKGIFELSVRSLT